LVKLLARSTNPSTNGPRYGRHINKSVVAVGRHDCNVRMTVRDNSTGILAEILERIFDPLFPAKGPDKGSGLSLSIVRKCGGDIAVEREPGKGAGIPFLRTADAAPLAV
jgi:signal transduction histidine kinase